MNNELDRIIDSLREPMLSTLTDWLKIPSVKGEASDGAPFGAPLRRMLDTALSDCEDLGFRTLNADGYIGHAEMGEGADEDALAILVHLDVVPPGDGWTCDPFGAQLTDGKLYARGASDNKGPAAAALYAMYAVKQLGIPLRRKVRLILGCDEESGWQDIEHYKKTVCMPRSGFSPDAGYPVINVEKGMAVLHLKAPAPTDGLKVVSFNTGERRNVVPGSAEALVEGGEELARLAKEVGSRYDWPVEATASSGTVRIKTTGITGHAAYPEHARNAIGQMLIILTELGAQGPYRTLRNAIGLEYHGQSLGIAVEDSISGKLTNNLGIIRADADNIFAVLDLRCPLMTRTDMLTRLAGQHLPGFSVSLASFKEPHFVPAQSHLVTALLDAYHEVTGLEKVTMAIGGGTYARALAEGVAFGALFPDEEDIAHQADEYVRPDSLHQSMRIFARAIIKLAGVKQEAS
ncbi:MAG: M20 family metallopeptidase [Clostridiales bacterium]|nr:M20 family metallopeptidase [Clostridiales bacterium]